MTEKISLAKETKQILQENGIILNKNLGQNYLIDDFKRKKIIEYAKLTKEDTVLEIGPGIGTLTIELAKKAKKVIAIEQDTTIFNILKKRLEKEQIDNVELINGDAVKVDFPPFNKIVSNLPYQAGTRILLEIVLRIGRGGSAPETMVVLVQSEVADRLAAGPGSKTRGLAGVWVQLDYDVEPVRKIAASCFWPRPEIDSTVVRLSRHHRNDALDAQLRDLFHKLTKTAFEHRRKQLGSTFKGLVQSTARAEQLSNQEWLDFTKGLANAYT